MNPTTQFGQPYAPTSWGGFGPGFIVVGGEAGDGPTPPDPPVEEIKVMRSPRYGITRSATR